MTVEEFQVGQLYTVGALSREKTNGDTSVQILSNEPFENELGVGQYTHKVYGLGSKVPGFIKVLFPASYFQAHEKAWNCYPYCRTEYTTPALGERFSIIIETIHLPDNGSTENAHNLTPAQLQNRKVRYIDIAVDKGDESSSLSDPTLHRSEKADRGPLYPGWLNSMQPVMCCYKLAHIKCEIPFLTSRSEGHLEKMQYDVMLEFARQTFVRMDEWYGLSMDDIRTMEERVRKELEDYLSQQSNKA